MKTKLQKPQRGGSSPKKSTLRELARLANYAENFENLLDQIGDQINGKLAGEMVGREN